MELFELLLGIVRILLTGAAFAAALRYMEGRRVLRGIPSAAGCLTGGGVACLLSDGLLYGVAGFSSRPFLGLLAGIAMAALVAAACSGARVLLAGKKRQTVRLRSKRRVLSGGVRAGGLNRAA